MSEEIKPDGETNKPTPDPSPSDEFAVLRANLEGYKEGMREPHHSIRLAITILTSAVGILVAFIVARDFFLIPRQTATLKKELLTEITNVISAEMTAVYGVKSSNIDASTKQMVENTVQLTQGQFWDVMAAAWSDRGYVALNVPKDYAGATFSYVMATSFYLKVNNYGMVQSTISQLTGQCLPNMYEESLFIWKRNNNTIYFHLTNLVGELNQKSINNLFARDINTLESKIGEAAVRKKPDLPTTTSPKQ